MATPTIFPSRLTYVLGLLLLVTACETSPPARIEITQLEPAEAARLATEIRESISPELAEGLSLSLWASDSLVADPIALKMDPQGRAYITRTHRQKNSEFDIRGYRHWMTASISLETVEDRRAFLRKTFAPENSAENEWLPDLNGDSIHDWHDLTVQKEQIYRIEDVSGDGVADQSQLFTEDFHEEITDVAGALLPFGKDVYVGVAPDLWRLRDTDKDGWADEKESLSHGYAVHIGFGAHGMSGLTYGPDGRIYWSIGDIGFSITDANGKNYHYPNQGAIFRSNPDGSGFEVFAAGLRNTHEFVFDKFGNLITVDNDGDHPGEKERIVYVTEGSDSGWRANWQYGKYTDPNNNSYKVWMDEDMFKPRWEGQAAHITPPIMNYHSGPTGMLYNPGTALGKRWQDRFIIGEFTGSPARSHIYAFELQPKGAGFEFVQEEAMLGGVLASGIDFGPDGALYLADWMDGWGTKNYGRIWKLDVSPEEADPLRGETQTLLQADFSPRAVPELANWLQHADMRVRLKAQFELSKRSERGVTAFSTSISQTEHQIARLHGIWGLGQMIRADKNRAKALHPWLSDPDPEVRAQTAKTIGDVRDQSAVSALLPLLADEQARVRFFAAEALGRLKAEAAIEPLIQMLADNEDEDAYLRHAGALALSRIGQADPLLLLSEHKNRGLRIAAVVALRRMKHAGVARFLQDEDEFIVTETARAIHDDWSIPGAMPELARLLETTPFQNEPLLRRLLNANFRLGEAENLQRLVAYSQHTEAPLAMRVEALACLSTWTEPSVLDRVDGRNRNLQPRDAAPLLAALEPILPDLLNQGEPAIQMMAAETVRRLRISSVSNILLASLLRTNRTPEFRVSALEALAVLEDSTADAAVQIALKDQRKAVRMAALRLVPRLQTSDERKVELLSQVLGTGSMEEQQSALQSLAALPIPETDSLLSLTLDRFESGKLPNQLQLDLKDWVASSETDSFQTRLATIEAEKAKEDPLAEYLAALEGGDANAGRRIFYRNEAAQCVRCHAINGSGGDVGPDLSQVGTRYNRRQLLESLVLPSATVAPGYGIVSLELKNGQLAVGTLVKENGQELVLKTEAAEPLRVPQASIAKRTDAPSSMPAMGLLLEQRQLRDVVEFLSGLK
jgi:putative membrane-bound dehydrogenase-like protein